MKLEKIKINKKWLVFFGLLFFFCVFFGGNVLAYDASINYNLDDNFEVGSTVGSFLLEGANFILYGILKLSLILLSGSMWLLDVMISPKIYNEVFLSSVAIAGINTAWSFVRDFFNLFFILIILLIGISTILGVSKFKDKSILVQTVFAAILINFSKPLTLIVIDTSQIFMRFFADALTKIEFATQIQKTVNFQKVLSGSGLGDNFTYFVIIVSVIIMTLIMAVMLFYLAMSLVVRMVAFWVLIILSPMAVFGYALEGTGGLGSLKSDWLSKLISWAFYGPILLFFLWLAVILVTTINSAVSAGISGFSSLSSSQLSVEGGLSDYVVKLFGIIIPYITAIYLLFYGYEQSQKMAPAMAKKILDKGEARINGWRDKAKGAAYQLTLPGTREAAKAGLVSAVERKGDEKGAMAWVAKRLTKSGRADVQAKKTAQFKNAFGDKGDALRDYNRSKAQETLKKWKDGKAPSEEELNELFSKGDIAATLFKSQENKIKSVEDYTKAMETLEGDNSLKERVERETKKENLGAVVDYKINEDIKKAKETGGSLHGLNENSSEYKNKIDEIKTQKNQEEINKKGLKDIFKNQNKGFYIEKNKQGKEVIKDSVLEALYQKALNYPDKLDRRKMAIEIKDTEVINLLRSESGEMGEMGKYILGDI